MTYDEPDFEGIEELVPQRRRAHRVIAAVLAIALVTMSGALTLVLAITHTGTAAPRRQITSRRGDVTYEIPGSWVVSAATEDSWVVTSFSPDEAGGESGLADGQFKVDFNIGQAGGITRLDALGLCDAHDRVAITACETVSIGGRLFKWATTTQSSDSGAPVFGFALATIANGRIYRADGIVPDGARKDEGIAQVEQILASIQIRSES